MDFILEITRLSRRNINKCVSSGTFTSLPLPSSFQTLFSTSTTLWTHLLEKGSFLINEKYVKLIESTDGYNVTTQSNY